MPASRHAEYARIHFRLRPGLRAALARLNLSQNELARRCDLSSGYMSQLLTGARFAGPKVRDRISQALGMNFDSLFEEVGRDA